MSKKSIFLGLLAVLLVFLIGLLIGFGSSYYIYSYTNIIRIEESQDLERQHMMIDEQIREATEIIEKINRNIKEMKEWQEQASGDMVNVEKRFQDLESLIEDSCQ